MKEEEVEIIKIEAKYNVLEEKFIRLAEKIGDLLKLFESGKRFFLKYTKKGVEFNLMTEQYLKEEIDETEFKLKQLNGIVDKLLFVFENI